MISVAEIFEKLRKTPTDVVGLDVASSGTKAVRIRNNGGGLTLVAVDVLPTFTMPDLTTSEPPEFQRLSIPLRLRASYASLCYSADSAIVKLLSFPGQFGDAAEARLLDSMGIEEPDDFRIAYKVLTEGHGKAESRVLTVAVPDDEMSVVADILPSGLPATYSLEVSGLATISAFLHSPAVTEARGGIGVIDFGMNTSTFALINDGVPSLVRRFDVGTTSIIKRVEQSLGVDEETAMGILADGAFDISQPVSDVMDPLLKQLIVSRDFVERRENCQIRSLYVSGGLVEAKDAVEEMRTGMGIPVETWNPFDGVTVGPATVPEKYVGQEWRFAAAVGACLATFEAS